MKRIFLVLITTLLISVLYNQDAEAVFSIDLNFYSIDFGELDMGDIKDDVPSLDITITCTTDQGNAWYLKVKNETQLTHTINPSSFIPDTNLYWRGVSTTGSGTLTTGYNDFTVDDTPTVYSSSVGEGASGINIMMDFKVVIPQAIQSGTYTTRIVFTFTE